ncbi:MAG: exodeoxyribonuclease VII small subunit [Desulfovibrionaceae bacterium]|nr:exodeoxyribonuclease VII small subunit [Desulfovibrionaceae bacterium]
MPEKKPMEFEEQLNRLREITDQLEKGQPSLERGLSLYKEGVGLARDCRRILEEAEHAVHLYAEDGLKDFVRADEEREAQETDLGL